MISGALALALVVAGAAVLFLVVRLATRPPADDGSAEAHAAERAVQRQHANELERLLAVELHKSSAVPALQEALATAQAALEAMRADRGRAESDLAVARETIKQDELRVLELRTRLDETEITRAGLASRIAALTAENADFGKELAHQAALVVEKVRALGDIGMRHQDIEARLHQSAAEGSDLKAQIATLTETLEQERRHAMERLRQASEVRESMTKEFKLLAEGVMARHGETFSKQNKEQIDLTLSPLREKLTEFQQGLQTAHTESEKERARLAEQIRQLSESSAKMTLETHNLTQALKGKSQTQGAWGEMILTSILEKSGLRVGQEYVTQESTRGEDGQLLRPDAVVHLPEGRRIVIDSKLSLTAFEAHLSGETEEERGAALVRHASSLRTHVKTLAAKAYHSVSPGSHDYTVMFVPIEGALAVALQHDAELTSFAVENNVCIATPTTLMIVLRTASNVWQVERRNRNADAISERAGKIYDKFVGFVGDMTALGGKLGDARQSFESAMGKLSSGRGNLVGQAQQLKTLGAKSSKTLPLGLLDDEAEETRVAVLAETN